MISHLPTISSNFKSVVNLYLRSNADSIIFIDNHAYLIPENKSLISGTLSTACTYLCNFWVHRWKVGTRMDVFVLLFLEGNGRDWISQDTVPKLICPYVIHGTLVKLKFLWVLCNYLNGIQTNRWCSMKYYAYFSRILTSSRVSLPRNGPTGKILIVSRMTISR